jgi:hypothetical protein
MTEITKSLIEGAGSGVFTTRKFKKGEEVCVYNAKKKKPVTHEDNIFSIVGPNNEDYIGVRDTTNGIGQYVNDYANLNVINFTVDDICKTTEIIQNYKKLSLSNQNVIFKKKFIINGGHKKY